MESHPVKKTTFFELKNNPYLCKKNKTICVYLNVLI
jgi:hypothetical protein